MIDLEEPLSTTNGYGPVLPTQTPTVINFPAEAFDTVIGTVDTAGPLDGEVLHWDLPLTGIFEW
jgi:hypothetical protein